MTVRQFIPRIGCENNILSLRFDIYYKYKKIYCLHMQQTGNNTHKAYDINHLHSIQKS